MRKVEVLKSVKVSDYKFKRVVDYVGFFHGWGIDYDNNMQYTVAIVEHPETHEVALVYYGSIRFLSKPNARVAN